MLDELLMRQVPQDLTAEQSLLGAMLVDPNCIPEVIEQVRSDDFYADENKRIFEVIYSMFNGAQRIDPVTVLDMLTRMGYYDEAGGRAYLFQLMDITPGSRNVTEYVRIVRDKSLLRQLADAGSEIQQNAISGQGDASGIAELAEQRIYNIRQGREIKGLSKLENVIADLYTELNERMQSDSDIPGMSTGFHALDKALTGLNKSDLILLAARPGMGKTSFALSLALNAARQGVKVGIFSLEMSGRELAQRIICAESGVSISHFRMGTIPMTSWNAIAAACCDIPGNDIEIEDRASVTIGDIRTTAARMMRGAERGLIVIDYLQLISSASDGAGFQNRAVEVGEISRRLKVLAKELGVPVVTLAQLSRQAEFHPGAPRLSDLRESGSIEQDADTVLFLSRDPNETGDEKSGARQVILSIAKNRSGPTGDIDMLFVPTSTKFYEVGPRKENCDD